MLKTRKILLYDNTVIYQIYFNSMHEKEKIDNYLEMLDVDIICTTYLEHGGYIDYYFKEFGND